MEQDSSTATPKKDDGFLALLILAAAIIIVTFVAIYFWRTKSTTDSSWQQNSFTPPAERQAYIEAKQKLKLTDPVHVDELKKLLMRRAMQTIPILLSLQSEGTSIERLYKRGMLTDDMHFKVKELKAFVDQEYQDVQFEANELIESWGDHIWPQAMQFHTMIQKQAETKTDEKKSTDSEKKKEEQQKKKENSKAAKKLTSNGSNSPVPEETAAAVKVEPVVPLDPEEVRRLEAERIAKELIEEEEKERQKQESAKKKQQNSGSKGSKKN